MNDRYKELLLKATKRLDLVAMGALLLLLIIVGYMFLAEQQADLGEPEQPPRRQWTVKLPDPASDQPPDPYYVDARSTIIDVDPDINANPRARRIIQNPLFVMRSAAEQAEFQEEMNRLYIQADRLFSAGQHEEARVIVDNILAQDPANRNARALLDRLNRIPSEGSTPTPAP